MTNWNSEDYSNISAVSVPNGTEGGNNLIMAFEDIVGEETMQTLWEANGEDLPADEVESILLERFPFTAEQLHEILAHIYNQETNTYTYGGGRGGGPIEGAVVDLKDNGEYIYLTYELFTGYSGLDEEPASYLHKTPGVLTIKQSGNAYRYWSVEVEETVEAEAKAS